ncbi:hypothetical protein TNCV_1999001 [Trichonephila clavipes]|nr:hypothetical protein TNCV_1999001 [Trichonephila clavipes]
MSLSSFRKHQDRPNSRVGPRRKKVSNTHRRSGAVGCRCHRSACTKTQPDIRGMLRRKKGDVVGIIPRGPRRDRTTE